LPPIHFQKFENSQNQLNLHQYQIFFHRRVFGYTEEWRERALRNSGNQLFVTLRKRKVPIPGRKRNYNLNTIMKKQLYKLFLINYMHGSNMCMCWRY